MVLFGVVITRSRLVRRGGRPPPPPGLLPRARGAAAPRVGGAPRGRRGGRPPRQEVNRVSRSGSTTGLGPMVTALAIAAPRARRRSTNPPASPDPGRDASTAPASATGPAACSLR